jgi:hypothetical protein
MQHQHEQMMLQQQQQLPRDPRIIDLNLTTSAAPSISSQSASLASTPRQGSPVQFQQQLHPHPNGFNTMPINGTNFQNNMSNGVNAPGIRMMGPQQVLLVQRQGVPAEVKIILSPGPIQLKYFENLQ